MAKTTRPKERSLLLALRIDNDAFQDGGMRAEIARILCDVAQRIDDGDELPLALFDINGNRVGEITGPKLDTH